MRRDAKIASGSLTVPHARETIQKVMAYYEDRSKPAMARSGMRAFEHSDTLTDDQLHERDRAIALQNHAKNLQLAHQCFPQTQGTNVAVQVNVPLPSLEEREQMRQLDRKLDAL